LIEFSPIDSSADKKPLPERSDLSDDDEAAPGKDRTQKSLEREFDEIAK
jgi:hypothetical protein